MTLNTKHLKSTIGTPFYLEEEFPLSWSMSRNERYCLIQLLQKIQPDVAIEIGTYNGGSLQVLSKFAKKVYAIDNDPSVKERLAPTFDNVEFLIGDSKTIIPKLIEDIQLRKEQLEFILIDGDHSAEGVYNDIKNILTYIPKTQTHILLHDSFNPECRKGMKRYKYAENKHVHYVELDYITGAYHHDGLYREMWGGFAHIGLSAKERQHALQVHESQKKLYTTTYLHSIHFIKNSFRFLKPLKRFFTSN